MSGPICPVLSASAAEGEERECIRERCAWWDEKPMHCLIVSIGYDARTLPDIREHTKHSTPSL